MLTIVDYICGSLHNHAEKNRSFKRFLKIILWLNYNLKYGQKKNKTGILNYT